VLELLERIDPSATSWKPIPLFAEAIAKVGYTILPGTHLIVRSCWEKATLAPARRGAMLREASIGGLLYRGGPQRKGRFARKSARPLAGGFGFVEAFSAVKGELGI